MNDRIPNVPPEAAAPAAVATARQALADADDLLIAVAPPELLAYHVAALRQALRGLVDAVAVECGARRPGWEKGPAIGRHRIPCVLPAGHQGGHRDGLGQTWEARR